MRSRRRLEALTLATLLIAPAGCAGRGSAHYYILAGVAPAATASAVGGASATVGVGPVKIPGYVDRPQIVTRKSPDEIDLADGDRWGEPLADGMPRTIADNLGALLPNDRIALYPWAGPRIIQYQVIVDVTRFDGVLAGDVALEARWRILGPDRSDLREGRFARSEPTGGPGYPALVAALSRAVGSLSREIASALNGR